MYDIKKIRKFREIDKFRGLFKRRINSSSSKKRKIKEKKVKEA